MVTVATRYVDTRRMTLGVACVGAREKRYTWSHRRRASGGRSLCIPHAFPQRRALCMIVEARPWIPHQPIADSLASLWVLLFLFAMANYTFCACVCVAGLSHRSGSTFALRCILLLSRSCEGSALSGKVQAFCREYDLPDKAPVATKRQHARSGLHIHVVQASREDSRRLHRRPLRHLRKCP